MQANMSNIFRLIAWTQNEAKYPAKLTVTYNLCTCITGACKQGCGKKQNKTKQKTPSCWSWSVSNCFWKRF